MYFEDTIVAIATPPGRGSVGIIRISGSLVPTIVPKILNISPKPRKAEYSSFLLQDGSPLDRVIAIFFPKPNSFTGEHVLEIHGHGGPIILDLMLTRILQSSNNIRIAQPGEFTKRAFLNEKIDLIQAEAIADIIEATSYQAAKSAALSLQGDFSKKINEVLEKITYLRMYIESSIDFSEEINNISYDAIYNHLKNISNSIQKLHHLTSYGILLKEGIKIIIAGKPNAGKSSLFNKLIGTDRAIVSTIAGTTRDILHESVNLDGLTVHFTDTAGLKTNSDNEIEIIGIKKAWNELTHADHILWVIDSNERYPNSIEFYNTIFNSISKNILYNNNNNKNNTKNVPTITFIRNKSDLSKETVGINRIQKYTIITLSTLLNDGLDLLKKHLKYYTTQCITPNNLNHPLHIIENQGNFIARRRHLNSIEKASKHIQSAYNQLLSLPIFTSPSLITNSDTNNKNINETLHHSNQSTIINEELLAEELKLAHNELTTILGQFTSDDLLEKIFSTFCIGK